jgi:nitrite reductase/ring-hydroxylating ferredoxin subunit
VAPGLVLVGISIIGTWGIASLGFIVAGIFILFFPGEAPTVNSSGSTLPGIIILITGFISLGLMQMCVAPLLGIDLPFPVRAKNIVGRERLTRWGKAGMVRDLPDGLPKEVRILSRRVTLVRMGEQVYALAGLCTHARLPLAGLPGSPVKPYPIRDECVMCPFHGARFELETGRCVRQPFTSEFNNEHPFLGRLQAKLFKVGAALPGPKNFKPSMDAEDIQTYPVRIEDGDIWVGLPQ